MAASSNRSKLPVLPRGAIDIVTDPVQRFMRVEAASGVVLLAMTTLALYLANSQFAESFLAVWETPISLAWGEHQLKLSALHWINDGLMMIFFFVVGLEVKREIVSGEFRELRNAVLPLAGALGGMLAPAAIYFILQWQQPGQRGWGIPMATDIAFVVGCMALLGRRVPHALRIMMLTLAIADDIGAIFVIALGYTDHVHLGTLGIAAVAIAGVWLAARLGVRSILVYVLLGAVIWFFFHESGVHATIGGVILGLMTPARAYLPTGRLGHLLDWAKDHLDGNDEDDDPVATVRQVRQATREAVPISDYLEQTLHPWVGFAIMPVFALANAGVPVSVSDVRSPVAIAVIAGLVLGKPLGILLFSWLSVRCGLAQLPACVSWPALAGAACLGGIGFTMALFLAGLALEEPLLSSAKIGILAASGISAALGTLLLVVTARRAVD